MIKMPPARPPVRVSLMDQTPDRLAQYAAAASIQGNKERAFELTAASIRSRAYWYILNGVWKPRNLKGLTA